MDTAEEKDARMRRLPTRTETFSLLLFMVLIFTAGTRLGMNYVPLLILVAGYACFIAWRCGYSWTEIEKAVGKKIGNAASIFTIFLAVGMLVGALIYCGTVPMLIYYGTKFLSPRWIYLCAFLLCGIFSVLTGTSHGSIGTAGLAMVSLGEVIPGTNMAMLAGAVVCGAILGDKISPFSDTTLMAAVVTGNDVYDHVAHQFKTVGPAAAITIIIYVIPGFFTPASSGVMSPDTLALQESLSSIYHWHFLLIVPALIVVGGAIMRRPTTVTIIVSALAAVIIGSLVQGFSLKDGITSLYSGFNVSMVPGLDASQLAPGALTVCNRGGMTFFVKTFFTAFICYYFAASAELSGTMQVILDVISRFIRNTFTLVLSTGVMMVILNCLCGSSTPSCSVVGPLLKPKYEEFGLHSVNLSRSIEDFGTGSTAFIPWSASGALYAGIVGVSNMSYFRYSFFLWIVWILALFYAATGICIKKLEPSGK